MLFKTTDGTYIEIIRSYFKNDSDYYNMILSVKGFNHNYSAKVIKHSDTNIDINADINIHNHSINEVERIKSIIKRTS